MRRFSLFFCTFAEEIIKTTNLASQNVNINNSYCHRLLCRLSLYCPREFDKGQQGSHCPADVCILLDAPHDGTGSLLPRYSRRGSGASYR